MANIRFDRYSIIIDNKRVLLRTAAVHYFRLPGESLWYDRLSKLKHAGYNCIDMYLYWGYHSENEGSYSFSGIKDIKRFMDIAYELGLYLIIRPGPFINAELSAGGFPGWLLKNKDLILRNRKENEYIYSDLYMEYVREWYKEVIPIINTASNVIALQVENEYSTNEMEETYIQELITLVRSLGCNLPITHNDMYGAGLYSDLVDIYASDNYSVTYFDHDWKDFPEVFSVLDHYEENLRFYSPESPMYIAELQAGWFDKWGGMGYDKMSQKLGREHLDIVTKTALSQGITIFTHYMGCGGTNWGNLASTEVYTSYDFAAPLTEQGTPTDRFYQAQMINNFLQSFDLTQTILNPNQPKINSINTESGLFYRSRLSLSDSSKWLFIRNDNYFNINASINSEFEINLAPHEMVILPSELPLQNLKIVYSSMPLLCKINDNTNQLIIPKTTHPGSICFNIPEDFEVIIPENHNNISIEEHNDNSFSLIYNENPPLKEPLTLKIKTNDYTTTFLFLPEKVTDYISLFENHILIGSSFIKTIHNELYAGTKESTKLITVNSKGISKISEVKKPENIESICLNNWELSAMGREIINGKTSNDWIQIESNTDADSNDLYEGFFWYSATYKNHINSIRLNIRHCFAVYLNGIEVYSNDIFNVISGKDTEESVIFDLPKDLQKNENSIVLLVQSMGHNKGFEDDAANPRGLIGYETIPHMELKWSIKQALTYDEILTKDSAETQKIDQQDKLVCAETSFTFNNPNNHFVPLGLVLENVPFNKACIYLNSVLIGHFWQDKGPQTKFYLPESLYNSNGLPNDLKLIIWYRNIDKIRNYPTNFKNANIYIEPWEIYKLTAIKELM